MWLKQHLLLKVLEAGKSKIKEPASSVPSEKILLVADGFFLAISSSHEGRERTSPLPLFIRTKIPSWELHPHDPFTSQRPPFPNTSTLGLHHMNFRGTQNIADPKLTSLFRTPGFSTQNLSFHCFAHIKQWQLDPST